MREFIARVRRAGVIACLFSCGISPIGPAHATDPLTRFAGSNGVLPASDTIGATAAEFGVTPNGQASYSIPITVPVGTTGVQPKLALQFTAPGGDGPLGYGGSISGLSYITRCASDLYHDGVIHAVDFTTADKFCLNGQRLVAITGTYGADGTEYRTSPEEFSKIISYGSAGTGPQRFVVYKKSGEILEYGNTADSRIEALGKSEARVWALNKLSDRAGNYIAFNYFEDANGDFGPLNIQYTGNAAQGLAPYNRIDFVYDTSTNPKNSYSSGQQYTNAKRLTNIKVYADATLFRDYQLAYQSAKQVSQLKECTPTACLKPTTLDWINSEVIAPTRYFSPMVLATSGIGGSINSTTSHERWGAVAIGDVNGDGITDQVMMKLSSLGSKVGTGDDEVWLGSSSGEFISVNIGSSPSGTRIFGAADYNGDGRLDLLVRTTGYQFWFGQENGTFTKTATTVADLPSPKPTNPGSYRLVAYGTPRWSSGDFNGDGISDLYVHVAVMCTGYIGAPIVCGKYEKIALSNGDGTFTSATTNYLQPNQNQSAWRIVSVGDFNGDGRDDMYMIWDKYADQPDSWTLGRSTLLDVRKTDTQNDKVLLSKGDGTFVGITLPAAQSIPKKYKIAAAADFNGDGLADFYIHPSDSYGRMTSDGDDRLFLSKGDGTFEFVSLIGMAAEAVHAGWMVGAVGDFDGDNYADIYAYKADTDGRKSSGGVADVIWLGQPNNTFISANVAVADSIPAAHKVIGAGDYDGDGTNDFYSFLGSTSIAGTSSGDPSDRLYQGLKFQPDLLSSITNGLGNRIDVTYKPLTDSSVYTKGTGAVYPAQDVQAAIDVVAEVKADNGVGGQNSQSYKYQALRSHLKGAGSLGFAKMTVTDDATGIVTISEYSQDYANIYQGTLSHGQTVAPGGVVLEDKTVSLARRCFGTVGTANYRCFNYSPQTVSTKLDLNGASLGTVTETTTYDDYGFATQQQRIATLGASTFTTKTDMVYSHDPSTWIMGRLTSAIATHQASGKPDIVRHSGYSYDPATGLLATETVEPGDALTSTKTYTRNGYGAVSSVAETWGSAATSGIAATSRSTSYGYDTRFRYRTTETNPLGQSQTSVYDPVNGLATSVTGPNGLATTQAYDAFGLPNVETRADGTTSKSYRYWCDSNTPCPANGAYVAVAQVSGAPLKAVYKDKLNRTIRETSQGLDGRLIDVDTLYDTKGNVVQHSDPTLEGDTPRWTSIIYDLLNRPTLTTRSDAATQSVTYNGLVSTSTNELGQTKTITKDVMGRMLAARDNASNVTTYAYDALGQLTAIVDPAGNSTTTAYDILGNRTSGNTPDQGNWTYRYNALGLLVDQTDAKGQRTSMTYDVLGRMLTRIDDAAAASPGSRTSTWVYDTQPKGIGKLSTSSGYGYQSTVTYDSLGRPSSTDEVIDGSTYTVATTYDTLGRPATVTYPSGLVAANGYSASGQLEKISDATGTTVYWRALTSDARGNITAAQFANGVQDNRTYDPATGFLTGITSTLSATTVRSLSYTWDKLGNLQNRVDNVLNVRDDFTYDTLNRVTQSQTTTGGTVNAVTVTYNNLGNITSKSDVGTYAYGGVSCGGPGPHAVTAVTGPKTASYCYDLNGAMISGDGRAITWSAFGMPTRIEQGLRAIDIAYGPDRSRFRRVDSNETGTSTTHYVAGGSYEVIITATGQVTRRLTIGGSVVILDTQTTPGSWQSQVQYLLTDHLGSLDIVTDGSGAIVERASFDAWGKRRQFDWTVYTASMPFPWQGQKITRGYTFHEQLDPVGLVHMNGRVYDPELGRFMSPDIAIQDISNLQSLNAYTYVNNNPLSFTDPSGYFLSGLFKAIGNFFKSVFKAIASVFKAILNSQIGRALIQIAACATALPACLAAAGGMALAAGGSVVDAIKAIGFSFISAGTWDVVGSVLQSTLHGVGQFASQAISTVTHAVVGGALSVAQGGSFLEGFASAGLGSVGGFAGADIAGNGPEGFYVRTAFAATAGGLASEITGGKFANGAITASFAHLFNDESHYGCMTGRCMPGERGVLEGGDAGGGFAAGIGLTGLGAALQQWGAAPFGNIIDWLGSLTSNETRKIPNDAYDPDGAKAPGKPTESDGFPGDPKGGEQWVGNPNGKGCGWLDCTGDIWVPTGQGSRAHGGPHWDVQSPNGGYKNVYPGGRQR